MSKFYFFTDADILSPQQSSQAFAATAGTVSHDEFRVTSLHTATQNPSAYAVCDGIVFIQQSKTDSNLVNLILKPTQQPPFALSKVKFFIYRGIQKTSLISGTAVAPASSNDLTASIWKSQAAKDKSSNTGPSTPPAEALGIDLSTSLADTVAIDDVFYRVGVSSQLPVVNGGMSIGKFAGTGFGFEIMIESVGFEPLLGKVRNDMNLIQVAKLPGSPTQAQTFEHWHDKEEILNYVDPSAFFGMFYHSKLKMPNSGGGKEKVKGDELYDKLLKGNHPGTSANFFNCNLVYLDIRNEFNFSFNYFKNYGTDINIAFDASTAVSTQNYYTSNWPLLTISNTDFPTNTSTSKNVIRISMPDGSGDNPLPTLYVSSGILDSTYPREPKDKNKLIDLEVTSGFTDEVKLIIGNRKGLTTTTCISSYIKLKYFKRFDNSAPAPVSSGTVIRAGNYLDSLFAPFAMKIPFAGNEKIKSVVFDNEVFLDAQNEFGKQLIVSIGKSEDIHNVGLFAYAQIIKPTSESDIKTIGFSISAETNNVFDDFIDLVASKNNAKARESAFIVGTTSTAYLEVFNDSTTPIVNDFEKINSENLFLINIDNIETPISEWQSIESLRMTNYIVKYPVYMGFTNKISSIDDNGYFFFTFDMVLRGLEIVSNNIQFKEINTNIKIYTNATD
jgi:hypothetical protein